MARFRRSAGWLLEWRSRSEHPRFTRSSPDQDRRAELLCAMGGLHRALPQRMADGPRRDQRQGRGSGRKLEIVSRDDGATTGSATRVADELVSREGVSLLFGSFLSNVGVAMADFANQKKIVYIAAEF